MSTLTLCYGVMVPPGGLFNNQALLRGYDHIRLVLHGSSSSPRQVLALRKTVYEVGTGGIRDVTNMMDEYSPLWEPALQEACKQIGIGFDFDFCGWYLCSWIEERS